jgi:hypothetical protein
MPVVPTVGRPPIEFRFLIQSVLSLLFRRERSPAGDILAVQDPAGGPRFELCEHTGANRAAAEKFISRCFAESFGARVEAFMPRLFSLRSPDGTIRGAFGLRSANHRLFVEHYLGRPIEQAIAEHTDDVVERRSIVEIGHFSGTFPAAMRALIWLLTERLRREGFQWIVFTDTSCLRNAFYRIGLLPIEIQAAALERIPEDVRATWGSYYDHFPWVLVVKVDEGFQTLIPNAVQTLPKSRRAG